MNTPIKLLLAILVLATAGLVYMLSASGREPAPLPNPTASGTGADPDAGSHQPLEGVSGKETTPPDAGDNPVRVKAEGPSPAGTEYAHGVAGVVVDPFDRPVANAKLYLMPGLGFDSLKMFEQHQKGVRFPPLAQMTTGPDGKFKLGIKDWVDGKQFEIRILHAEYCDASLPGLIPQPGEYVDSGITKLKVGSTVFGRVTNENGLPVPGAKVVVRDGSGSLNITPAPGREDGWTATTGANGDYEIRNLDPELIFAMTVQAQNFASEEKSELRLETGKRHQVDFQLVEGQEIAGTVVGPQGQRIAGARVTIAALSQKSQQTENTVTDREGRFATHGLRAGIYAVMVEADGYLSADEKPITAGQTDLTITLERTGTVIVSVLDKNGAPLANFHCNLKPAFEGQDVYGNALISRPVKGAKDGTVEITGVKPMTYVAEVFAPNHAKNFSERFTVTEGQKDPPRVTVSLNNGGTIHGFVRDSKGNPLEGVKIETMPNGMVENPFTKMFAIPFTITKKSMRSAKNGEFRFDQLNAGVYQLKFESEDHCSKAVNDIEVTVGKTTTTGDIQIERGCLVSGIAKVDGQPSAQVQINVSSVAEPGVPAMPFSTTAISDNEGKFVLNKRLPPGKYQVMAAQNVQANPLLKMVQFNKSKKKFTISPGVETYVLDVRLQKIE